MRYRLPYGRQLPEQQTSRHHTLHYNRWYRTDAEKELRGLLVIRLENGQHKELHANVPPPPKPNHDLTSQLLQKAYELRDDSEYQRFSEIATYLGDIAMTSHNDEKADLAGRMHENLAQQDGYIRSAYCERV